MDKLIFISKRVGKKSFSNLFSFSILLILLILVSGCSESEEEYDDSSSSASTTSDTTATSLSSAVISELSASLSSTSSSRQARDSSRSTSKTLSNSLTSSQITSVVDAATLAVSSAGMNNSEDLIQIMPKIIEGAQANLKWLGISDPSKIIKVINVIDNSLVKSINGRSEYLPSASSESGL